MKLDNIAYVSLSALRVVRLLLSSQANDIESRAVGAQHLSRDSGGADANNISIQAPAGRAVPSSTAPTDASAGSLSEDASPVGADDERAYREGSSFMRRGGGER
jgi:hypothetical protein